MDLVEEMKRDFSAKYRQPGNKNFPYPHCIANWEGIKVQTDRMNGLVESGEDDDVLLRVYVPFCTIGTRESKDDYYNYVIRDPRLSLRKQRRRLEEQLRRFCLAAEEEGAEKRALKMLSELAFSLNHAGIAIAGSRGI